MVEAVVEAVVGVVVVGGVGVAVVDETGAAAAAGGRCSSRAIEGGEYITGTKEAVQVVSGEKK